MNRIKPALLPLTALLTAVLLSLLRVWELQTGFDAEGLPVHAASHWIAIAVTVLCALLWLWLSRSLPKQNDLPAGKHLLSALLALLGAVLIACSCAAALYGQLRADTYSRDLFSLIASVCGLLGALCLAVIAGCLAQGKQPAPGLRIVPYVFLMLRLVALFRRWSIDPILLDYCFRHLGLLAALGGLYCQASLAFGRGSRRLTAFWAMGGVGLCAMSIAEQPLTEAALYLGLVLTLLGTLIHLCAADKAE